MHKNMSVHYMLPSPYCMNGGMIKPPIPHRQSQLVLHQNQHGYAVIKSNSHSHGVDLIKIRKQIGKPAHHVMVMPGNQICLIMH